MLISRTLVTVAAIFSFSPMLGAGEWNKLTRITVHEPIAVPGAVLTPGEYVIKLADSPTNRHIVRFLNGDQTEVISTVLAIPNTKMEPSGKTEFGWYETPAGQPPALRSWFYPGQTIGQEFVYPEGEARVIARNSKRNVQAVEDGMSSVYKDRNLKPDSAPPAVLETVRIYAWSPDNKRLESQAAFDSNAKLDATVKPDSRIRARFAQEGTRSRTSDAFRSSVIREVRHELVMLPYYGVFDNLEFRVDGTTVTLLGSVTRPTLKSSAENVVKDIEGVEQVVNKIDVLPLSPNDDRIRMATYRAIYGQAALSRYAIQAVPPIHIIVKNGDVTLEGVVATEADKNIAGIQANSVSGVFSVNNNLRIEGA